MKCRVIWAVTWASVSQYRDFDYVKDAIEYAHEYLISGSLKGTIQDSIRIVKLQPITTWEEGELIGGNEWIVMKATGLSPKEQKAAKVEVDK